MSLNPLNKALKSIYKNLLFMFIPNKLQKYFVKREQLLPEFTLTRRLPANFSEGDSPYFEREFFRSFNPVTLASLSNCIINLDQGLAIKYFSVVEESLMSPRMRSQYGFTFLLKAYLSHKVVLKSDQRYLLLYNTWSLGYGHWVSDIIPRFFILKDRIDQFKIILPQEYRSSWRLQTLLPFKVDEANIEYLKTSEFNLYKVPKLTIVSHVGTTCNVKDNILQEIRKFYWQYYGLRSKNRSISHRKIYVSRSKCSRRFVVNEDEVCSLLESLDFEILHFQDYSFEEQVKISSETQIMVGLTGSGLNNMMFMPSNSHVLEFKMCEDYHNLHYFGFASGLHLNYWYLVCDTIGLDRFTADFIVDINKLKSILLEITKISLN